MTHGPTWPKPAFYCFLLLSTPWAQTFPQAASPPSGKLQCSEKPCRNKVWVINLSGTHAQALLTILLHEAEKSSVFNWVYDKCICLHNFLICHRKKLELFFLTKWVLAFLISLSQSVAHRLEGKDFQQFWLKVRWLQVKTQSRREGFDGPEKFPASFYHPWLQEEFKNGKKFTEPDKSLPR